MEKKKNRILLLIDFSKYSEDLTNFAFKISEIIDAKVVLIHQITGMASGMADQEVRDEIIKSETEEAHSKLIKLANKRVYSHDSFHISTKPIVSILKEIESEQYFDLVFTGLKGSGALKRLFIGTTTLSIIEESNLLTVALPLQKKLALPNKLMVGINSNYPLNKNQFEKLLNVFENQIEQLVFFTILKDEEDENEARKHLMDVQKQYEHKNPSVQIYKGDDAFNMLKDKMDFDENSFLVLQQGTRSFSDKLFRKFMINELVYSAKTPLIVLSS